MGYDGVKTALAASKGQQLLTNPRPEGIWMR
jgi:hypothetical protein